MAPNSPKSAPEAPTEILSLFPPRQDSMLPPNPAKIYNTPILTAKKFQVIIEMKMIAINLGSVRNTIDVSEVTYGIRNPAQAGCR